MLVWIYSTVNPQQWNQEAKPQILQPVNLGSSLSWKAQSNPKKNDSIHNVCC